ncbi:hypothetical protein G6F37_002235 [Rhizopus arrhizus]|nr:hypothetical protein G6F38_002112 [Rhizopus arrhizus]KAG1162357.1 hypothetical protein G6F37_002235 [Rhizopus arrhizus]
MLQSQIINVLPRRILASLWTAPETRITLSHFAINKEQPNTTAISPGFLCDELPTRYTHILRLLSTLPPDSLQTPILRHVSYSYLRDICTLLHPSLRQISPNAFSNTLTKLKTSQALNLIRLRYALLSNPTSAFVNLMENINTIGIGIHLLLDQYISWVSHRQNHLQTLSPEEMTRKAVHDAQVALLDAFGYIELPKIEIKQKSKQTLDYIPSILHRILYEVILISSKAHIIHNQQKEQTRKWYEFRKSQKPISLALFHGPTSVGFKLESPMICEKELLPGIPRDPIGLPSSSSVLSSIHQARIDRIVQPNHALEWASLSGWRTAKSLASHWGGNLDIVNVDGLGASIYLALDRNTHLLERYPSHQVHRGPLNSSAASQIDKFLYTISDAQPSTCIPPPLYHPISLTAAAASQ